MLKTYFPKMVPVKQIFPNPRIDNIPETISQQFTDQIIKTKINPGDKVAVAVGSRGIANIKEIVATVIAEIKKLGGEPFIVPAMGSHGGATAEGQAEVLHHYGINENKVGAPIISSMETVQVGETSEGIPLFFDKNAFNSDAVVLVARVKPHTDFKGPIESGMLKMMAIGLGKHKGAETLHSQGFEVFDTLIPEAGRIIGENTPVKIGVAIIENAYEETCQIHVIPVEQIVEKEPDLLMVANKNMPRINVDKIDVLIVDEVGKDISGAGMDPNITGRFSSPVKPVFKAPSIQRMIVRDLSKKTDGNAIGFGMADITTRQLVNKIDFKKTYINAITATSFLDIKIPLIAESDQEALEIAVKTCNRINPEKVKIVWIKNTLILNQIYISETYFEDSDLKNIEVAGERFNITFDQYGNIANTNLFSL